jgi:hypothetical protein
MTPKKGKSTQSGQKSMTIPDGSIFLIHLEQFERRALGARTFRELHEVITDVMRSSRPDFYSGSDVIRKAFSSWSRKEVKVFYGIKGGRPKTTEVAKVRVPSTLTRKVVDRLKTSYLVLKSPYTATESARNYFVADVLFPLVEAFRGAMDITIEGKLGAREQESFAWGEVEFVCRVLETVVIKCVEAKKEDVEQGDTQAVLEMDVACTMNNSKGLDIPKVYGVVTLGHWWSILTFEKDKTGNDKVCSTEPLLLPAEFDPERIEKSVEALLSALMFYLCDGFLMALEAFHLREKMRYSSHQTKRLTLDIKCRITESEAVLEKARWLIGDIREADDDAKVVKAFANLERFGSKVLLSDNESFE